MGISLERETLAMIKKLVKMKILTDEDLTKINLIMVNRIEQLEKEAKGDEE